MEGWSAHRKMTVINKVTKPTIKTIFESVQISDWETPMTQFENEDINPDLDVTNLYSKISCLVAYLYSMELG